MLSYCPVANWYMYISVNHSPFAVQVLHRNIELVSKFHTTSHHHASIWCSLPPSLPPSHLSSLPSSLPSFLDMQVGILKAEMEQRDLQAREKQVRLESSLRYIW